jgi:GAF domain/ANTAR domain
MATSFGAAMESLERAASSPAGYCRPFLDLFPVSGAAVSTIGELLGSETVSASDDLAALLDELQFDLGEGPCWDALRRQQPVLEPDIRRGVAAWPAFAAAIRNEPVSSLFAFPLMVGPLRFGAVDLYSREPVTLDRTQAKQADAMAGVVGRLVLRRALGLVGRDYDHDSNAYSRRIIHQATGMVLAQLDLSPEDARLVIQGHAYAAARPMMEVAQEIVDGRLAFTRNREGIEASQ